MITHPAVQQAVEARPPYPTAGVVWTTVARGGLLGAPTSGLRLQGVMAYSAISYFRNDEKVRMPTRNVVLTERQEELLETLVKSGRYQNASEVLRDGLRLVEQREAEDAGKLKALRAAARAGVGALDRGEFREFGDIEELQAYLNDLSLCLRRELRIKPSVV